MDISLSELSKVKGIGKKTIQHIREYKLADEGYISEYDENLHLDRDSVNQGDCLELMNGIEDKSVDMILADLPYGTTSGNLDWDEVINLKYLWKHYLRVIKDEGAIVLTATHPFTIDLIMSKRNLFRYQWVWKKNKPTGFTNAKCRPLKEYEDILIFSKSKTKSNQFNNKSMNYFPQGLIESGEKKNGKPPSAITCDRGNSNKEYIQTHTNYPTNIIEFDVPANNIHPTQKPVKLFEYLIKTYTNEGDLVLDNVAGSGTTGVACQNTNRDYILIEKEQKYINVIKERLKN